MKNKWLWIIILVLIIIVGLAIFWIEGQQNGVKYTNDDAEKLISDQNKIDTDMKSQYENSDYTMDKPYIKVNPYDVNELSAYLAFNTDQDLTYKYTVEGKTKDADLTFKGPNEAESDTIVIPVFGLYQDYTNKVDFTFKTTDGKTTHQSYELKTGDLSPMPNLSQADYTYYNKDETKSKMKNHVIIDNYGFAYDINGDVRNGGFSADSRYGFLKLINGNYYEAPSEVNDKSVLYQVNAMGRVNPNFYSTDEKGDYINHDLTAYKDNIISFMSVSGQGIKSDDYGEAQLALVNSDDGAIIDTFDFTDFYKNSGDKVLDNTAKGDVHFNSLDYNSVNDELLINSRSYSQILSVNPKTKEINWIFDDPSTVGKDHSQYLLTPEKGTTFPNGEHNVEFVPDSVAKNYPWYEEGYTYMSMFDNKSCMNSDEKEQNRNDIWQDANMDACTYHPNSTGEVYAIDEDNKTVKSVASYEAESNAPFTSGFTLHDDYANIYASLESDYTMFNTNGDKVFSMVDPAKGFGATEKDPFTYRAEYINSQLFMDSMNDFDYQYATK